MPKTRWGRARTIGEALDLAPPGALISSAPGQYVEVLQVSESKPVTMYAEEGPGTVRVEGRVGRACLLVGGEHSIKGITFRQWPSGAASSAAVTNETLRANDCHIVSESQTPASLTVQAHTVGA